jgi:hypothetical protein
VRSGYHPLGFSHEDEGCRDILGTTIGATDGITVGRPRKIDIARRVHA